MFDTTHRSARTYCIWLILIVMLITTSSGTIARAADPVTLNVQLLTTITNQKAVRAQLDRFEKANPGIKVNLLPPATSASAQTLSALQGLLDAKQTNLDVFQYETLWTGSLANGLMDLTPALKAAKIDTSIYFPVLYNIATLGDRQLGIPYFTDAAFMFYRTDLLKKYGFANPPTTLDELEKMAKTIQDGERANNKNFWGYAWEGDKYESLTGAALEWQVVTGGGMIVEPDKTISLNNPQTQAALERAKAWIGTISPPDVLKMREEDTISLFRAGNVAFIRNWRAAFFRLQSDNKTKSKFGITVMPGGPSRVTASTVSGANLGVNLYSAHPEEAAKLALFLTSAAEDKQLALDQQLLPTVKNLYTDSAIAKQIPFIDKVVASIEDAAPRPATITGDKYADVSTLYFTAVHSILAGEAKAADALPKLADDISKILGDPFKIGEPPKQ